MPDESFTTAAGSPHKWVRRGSMGNEWWACECGAMSVDDDHPEQGGKLARPGDGIHYAHTLLAGGADATARLIVSNLAHRFGFAPDADSDQYRELVERTKARYYIETGVQL